MVVWQEDNGYELIGVMLILQCVEILWVYNVILDGMDMCLVIEFDFGIEIQILIGVVMKIDFIYFFVIFKLCGDIDVQVILIFQDGNCMMLVGFYEIM